LFCSTSMRTLLVPAFSVFSSSSFIIDVGCSIISLVAILLATDSGSMCIRFILFLSSFYIVRFGHGPGHQGNDERICNDYRHLPRNKKRGYEYHWEHVIADCWDVVEPARF